MTLEEFKQAFSSEDRPKIICADIREQAETYEFLLRVGYDLGDWERAFLSYSEGRRRGARHDFRHPRRSGISNNRVCTSNDKPREDDILFSEIEDLIRGDKITELPELDKLFGGF